MQLRTTLRDIAAAAAFGSIGLSGSVPMVIVVVFALALVLSFLGLRVLRPFFKTSAVVLLLLGIVIFYLVFRGGLDLIVAACSFATLVSCHRMLSEQTARTDLQVHLSSLLMMAGGAAISNDIWFGVCMLIFAGAASFALALTVIEGPAENTEDVPMKPVARALGLSVSIAFLGALAFFIFFPRLSWNIATRRSPAGLGGSTGMSDRVRLGGGGDIKTSARVVARITISPDPKADRLDAYWVGRFFDTYKNGEWLGHGKPSAPAARVRFAPFDLGKVRQYVTLLPSYESRTLIALDPPVWFQNANVSSTTTSQRASLVRVADEEVHIAEEGNAFTYEAFSGRDGNPLPVDDDTDLSAYRVLPDKLDPRVGELAAQVLAGEKDPGKAAAKLTRYLRGNYGYTLELPGAVGDPLANFLFERKEGHCEHFASALTLMLRSQGFASRVAAGFFGGERVSSLYVLRAGDAHAWTQVHVPRTGWVVFDATPENGRGGQPTSLVAWVTSRYEEIDNWWRQRVMDYSLVDQVGIVRTWVRPPREAATASAGFSAPPGRAIFAAAGLGLLTYALFRVFTRRITRKVHPASSFLDDLEKRAEKAKLLRQRGETLEDLVKRLAQSKHPLADAFSVATRRYLEARFGDRPLRPGERAHHLRQLDAALGLR
jgi:transglutaminase-like putative cysteine protease